MTNLKREYPITKTHTEMETRWDFIDQRVVVQVPAYDPRHRLIARTDAGTRWELRYVVENADVIENPDGTFTKVEPEIRFFGVKLTKKHGTPLTGHPHLLYWVRDWADLDAHVVEP